MTRGTRLLLAVVIGGVVLGLATLAATAAAVYHGGSVSVEIEEDGNHFQVQLPAGLVRAAIAMAPDSALQEAAQELEPWLPALDAGWRELEDAPDFVLFELVSDDETVLIEKTGSKLLVIVGSPQAQVRVGVPLGTVGSLLHKLDS